MVEKVLGSPFSFAGLGVESRLGSSFWVVLFAERTLVASASSLDGSFLSFHSQVCATSDHFLVNSLLLSPVVGIQEINGVPFW
ncbi:unnamed protein product [Arabidopsis halleri]